MWGGIAHYSLQKTIITISQKASNMSNVHENGQKIPTESSVHESGKNSSGT